MRRCTYADYAFASKIGDRALMNLYGARLFEQERRHAPFWSGLRLRREGRLGLAFGRHYPFALCWQWLLVLRLHRRTRGRAFSFWRPPAGGQIVWSAKAWIVTLTFMRQGYDHMPAERYYRERGL